MRNYTFLSWVLLLVNGVFGVDADDVSVSVMVGDSVTLHTDVTEVLKNIKIIWKFGGEIIARMNEADGNPSTDDGPGAIFRDRLKLDKQTGSLTITNIRTEHIGHYSVDVMSTNAKLKTFQVTVHDVVESVSVIEGDSVTLHTGVKVQRDDQIVWKFEDQVIIIAHLNGAADERWSNIDLNGQTGDLTIRNIRRDQYGNYKVEINTNSMILHKKFNIAVDEITAVSVIEGHSVVLRTGVLGIQGYDLITWKFEDHLMAEIHQETNRFSLFSAGGRFKDRLLPDHQTGSLTISKSRTTDSGDYHLYMKSRAHSLQRTISVTVSAHSGAASGICGAGVGLVVWAVTVFFATRSISNQGKSVSVNTK